MGADSDPGHPHASIAGVLERSRRQGVAVDRHTLEKAHFRTRAPRLLAEIEVPHSVVGPPNSIAVSADKRLALATSAERLDPADATKTIPDNRASVIDLRANPPRVTQTLEVGFGPSGVSINYP